MAPCKGDKRGAGEYADSYSDKLGENPFPYWRQQRIEFPLYLPSKLAAKREGNSLIISFFYPNMAP
jgi:hypothetical protein